MTEDDIKEELRGYAVPSVSEEAFDLAFKAVNDLINNGESSVANALLELSLGDHAPTSVQYEHITHNGGEGEGNHANGVFKLNDTFFDFSYGYQSYDGFQPEYGRLYVVYPVQKQITVYEAVY